MSFKIIEIDPTKCTFCFRMDGYDCYELRNGVCSLYLSNEDAENISIQEKNQYSESNVMYCRNLAKELLEEEYFANKSSQTAIYSIRLNHRVTALVRQIYYNKRKMV